MAKTGTYVRPELDIGSSRVFNCNDIARKLEKSKVEDKFFFKNVSMNTVVLIKEALTEERAPALEDRRSDAKDATADIRRLLHRHARRL